MSQIDTVITGQVAEKCLPALKQVADIPRLYRRTNRELPSKALAYVHELLQPIQDFNRQVKEAVESSRWGSQTQFNLKPHTCIQRNVSQHMKKHLFTKLCRNPIGERWLKW